VVALSPVRLAIGARELVAIVGPSGCGKSTLLRILAGLIAPSAGVTTIGGSPVKGPRRDIGMVFQDPVLLPWRTVRSNVLMPADVVGMERRRAEARADELLRLVHL